MSERTYAPRSGGRIAEQRGAGQPNAAGRRGRYRDGRAADAPTQGTSALQPADAPARNTGSAPRLRVAPPAPIQTPRAPFIVLVLVLVVAGVFGILLINTKTNENTFKLSKLQDQQTTLDNQQQSLENQIAGYESTGNLDAAARRLGLVKADTPAYIRLPDGKIIGVPKPGEGRPAVTAEDPAAAKRTATGTTPTSAASSPAGTSPTGAAASSPTGTASSPTGAASAPVGGTTAPAGTGSGTAGATGSPTGTTTQNAG